MQQRESGTAKLRRTCMTGSDAFGEEGLSKTLSITFDLWLVISQCYAVVVYMDPLPITYCS